MKILHIILNIKKFKLYHNTHKIKWTKIKPTIKWKSYTAYNTEKKKLKTL